MISGKVLRVICHDKTPFTSLIVKTGPKKVEIQIRDEDYDEAVEQYGKTLWDADVDIDFKGKKPIITAVS